MGMTIEEALTNLEGLQKDYQDFHDEVWKDIRTYSINAESLRIATDTMRKYQKILEIIDDYEGEGWERIAVGEIREVLNDGDDD